MAIQFRRGLDADLQPEKLLGGEPVFSYDIPALYVGDGKGNAIRIGEKGDSINIKGSYLTLADLRAAVTSPSQGDMYNVGTAYPYDVYVWQEYTSKWENQGPLRGEPGLTVSVNGIAPDVNGNITFTAADAGAIPAVDKGAASGVATLTSARTLTATQVPFATTAEAQAGTSTEKVSSPARVADYVTSQKGANNGVAPLNPVGQIPTGNLPFATTGLAQAGEDTATLMSPKTTLDSVKYNSVVRRVYDVTGTSAATVYIDVTDTAVQYAEGLRIGIRLSQASAVTATGGIYLRVNGSAAYILKPEGGIAAANRLLAIQPYKDYELVLKRITSTTLYWECVNYRDDLEIIRGSNTYGDYVKFPDGTMICTMEITATIDCFAWGGIFAGGSDATYNFPQTFITPPNMQQTLVTTSGSSAWLVNYSQPQITTNSFKYFSIARATAATGVPVKLYVLLTGKWK